MKIAIFGKKIDNNFSEILSKIFHKLHEHDIEIVIYRPLFDFIATNINVNLSKIWAFDNVENIRNSTEMIFSFGGDGTFLECVAMMKNSQLPIVGINTGRLGFLASISRKDVDEMLENLINKKYQIEKRTLLQAKVNDEIISIKDFSYALNEIAFSKSDETSMINIEVYLDGNYLNTYWSDGLLISTPTGSTAYSLSCGGPIIQPESRSVVITPIAPHTLTVRPFVVSDDVELKVKVHGRGKQFLFALDSRTRFFDNEVEITVSKANNYISMVRFENTNYLETLRKKLMWGLDIRN